MVGERRNAKRLPSPLADRLDEGVEPGTNSRTSCAQRQATAILPAHSSASSREGTSTTENPPMYALLSGYGPSVTVPSVATTLTSSWECSPPPNTQTQASFASCTPRALPRPRRGDPPRETSLLRHRTRSETAPSHDSFLGGLLRPHLTLLRTHAQWGPTNHRELIGPARSSLTSSGVIAAHCARQREWNKPMSSCRRRNREPVLLRSACRSDNRTRVGRVTLQRMDNVGIVVESLDAAISFFGELGLELEGRAMIEGDWSGRVTGLRDQRVEIAMM